MPDEEENNRSGLNGESDLPNQEDYSNRDGIVSSPRVEYEVEDHGTTLPAKTPYMHALFLKALMQDYPDLHYYENAGFRESDPGKGYYAQLNEDMVKKRLADVAHRRFNSNSRVNPLTVAFPCFFF